MRFVDYNIVNHNANQNNSTGVKNDYTYRNGKCPSYECSKRDSKSNIEESRN